MNTAKTHKTGEFGSKKLTRHHHLSTQKEDFS